MTAYSGKPIVNTCGHCERLVWTRKARLWSGAAFSGLQKVRGVANLPKLVYRFPPFCRKDRCQDKVEPKRRWTFLSSA